MAPVPVEAVCVELSRILESSEFGASVRGRRFLRYVVEETLNGRADRIKAFTIATEVFGRNSDFDAQNDPIVRIEAGRLRRDLERYYVVAGAADPVIIDIPKGGYVPTFSLRDQAGEQGHSIGKEAATAVAATPVHKRFARTAGVAIILTLLVAGGAYWLGYARSPATRIDLGAGEVLPGPTLRIAPFASLDETSGANLVADGLSEEITAQLARFRELTILERNSGADYSLNGTVRRNEAQIRITARLTESSSGRVLWSDIYERSVVGSDYSTIEIDVAHTIATAIAQPGGIIFRARSRGDRSRASSPDPYDCTLAFYTYRSAITPERHAEVRQCLKEAVRQYPDFATAWSLLAYIYIDEYRFEFNPMPESGPALERALEAARHAVRLDPANARAYQALMTALFYDGKIEDSLKVGQEGVALNPNDTELLGELGVRFGQAGYWERGDELLQQAVDRNPSLATLYNIGLAQSAYMRGDTKRAVHLIKIADMRQFPFYDILAALIYADANMEQDAASARQRFMTRWPHFFDDFEAELAKRYLNPADHAKVINDAQKAGFPVHKK